MVAGFLSSASMLWLERALAGAGVLREVVWGLACPVHCGSSGLPFLVLGFFIGLVVGIGIALGTLWTFYHLSFQPGSPPATAQAYSSVPVAISSDPDSGVIYL